MYMCLARARSLVWLLCRRAVSHLPAGMAACGAWGPAAGVAHMCRQRCCVSAAGLQVGWGAACVRWCLCHSTLCCMCQWFVGVLQVGVKTFVLVFGGEGGVGGAQMVCTCGGGWCACAAGVPVHIAAWLCTAGLPAGLACEQRGGAGLWRHPSWCCRCRHLLVLCTFTSGSRPHLASLVAAACTQLMVQGIAASAAVACTAGSPALC
jgi:hypothetical protein